jgi:NADH dehydrogenase
VKVLFAGGSGFLGGNICRGLLEDSHEVSILSRSPDRVASDSRLAGAEAIKGDVTDPDSLRGVAEGFDAVASSVQFPNFPVEQPSRGLSFDRYDRAGTENLLAEAKRAGATRFFYVSGVNVDPDSDKPWYRAKGIAERSIVASGLEYSILRPSWAYGPNDNALNRIAKIARYSPVVPKLGFRHQVIQPVYVDDIVLAAQRIFSKDEAWRRTFEIGGPEALTMTEITQILCRVMGKRRIVVPVPAILAKVATAPLDLFPSPVMNPSGVEFATQDGLADNTAIEEVLDVHPVAFEEGLRRYLD